MSDRSLDDARAKLMAEAAEASAPASFPAKSPFRRRGLVVGVAAAAAAIVGGAVAFGGSGGAPRQQPAAQSAQSAQPTTSQQPTKRDVSLLSASQVLNDTADKITAKDPELKPGQYRFIEVKSTYANSHISLPAADSGDVETGYTHLVDSTTQTWIPKDVTQDWLEKRIPGKTEYLASSMPRSEVPDYVFSDVQSGERRGACGDFFPKSKPKKVCGDTTDFGQPAFYEALSRDPDQLVAWLKDYTAGRNSAPTTMFHFGVQFLISGVMPADLRGPFLRAMAKIDGVKVVEEATTSDGRKGIALGIGDERERRDLIVDPDNGEVIGERTVAGDKPDSSWVKPGTVTGNVSLTVKVADAIGVVPAS